MIGKLLGLWGVLISPVHEIGHVLFGLASGNPTAIISWNMVAAERPGLIMASGGYLMESVFAVLLVVLWPRRKWPYLASSLTLASMFYNLTIQTDTTNPGVMMIWILTGVLAAVVVLYQWNLSHSS